MLKSPRSSNVELFFEDLLECIEYENQERVAKLLSIPEVVARSLLPNHNGKLEVLNSAAKGGSITIFEMLIQNPDILAQVSYYCSLFDSGLLGIAIENNHLGLVKKLLTFPEVVNNGKNLARMLGVAANLGHNAIVEELLNHPEIARQAYSALHFALDEVTDVKQIVCIQLLLLAPTVIEKIVAKQCTQIIHGFLYPEIAQLLLAVPEISAALHDNPTAALRQASTSEIAAVLSIPSLLNRFAQCQNQTGFDLVFYDHLMSEFDTDLQIDNAELVKKLLSMAPINDYFAVAAKPEMQKMSVYAGRLDLLQYYLKERQEDQEVDEELFSWGCEGGNIHVVLYLLSFTEIRKAVLSVTPTQYNFLNDAAVSGNVMILNLLLSLISYHKTAQLQEALISAAEFGHVDMVRRLLAFSDVYNDSSIKKIEAIVQAAKQGHEEVFILLLASSHDLSEMSESDINEILSSPKSSLSLIEVLFQHPSIAEHPNLLTETLLAAERGDLSLVSRMIYLPVVIAGLNEQPDCSIKLLKAVLKAMMKMDNHPQAVNIIRALDNMTCFNRDHLKQYLTKMQRSLFEAACPINPSVFVFPLEQDRQQIAEGLSDLSKSLVFSMHKPKESTDTPEMHVMSTWRADMSPR